MSGMTGGTTGTQIGTICCLLILQRTNTLVLLSEVHYWGCVTQSNKKTNTWTAASSDPETNNHWAKTWRLPCENTFTPQQRFYFSAPLVVSWRRRSDFSRLMFLLPKSSWVRAFCLVLIWFVLFCTWLTWTICNNSVQRDGVIDHFTVNGAQRNSPKKNRHDDTWLLQRSISLMVFYQMEECVILFVPQLHFLSHICNDFSIQAQKP